MLPEDLNCIGSCRVCLVDVEGEGLAASCNTAVREGMVVRTDTRAAKREFSRRTLPLWVVKSASGASTASVLREALVVPADTVPLKLPLRSAREPLVVLNWPADIAASQLEPSSHSPSPSRQ